MLLDLFNFTNYLSNLNPALMPLFVLGMSLVGSPHCVGMCGPICLINKSKKEQVLYHLGRLFIYLILGVLAGLLGQTILKEAQKPLLLFFSFILGIVFILSGLSILGIRAFSFQNYLKSLHKNYFKNINKERNVNVRAISSGFLSGLLPCGWLYAFVIFAITTQNPLRAGLFLFIFWVGTVPALSLTSFFYYKTQKVFNTSLKWILASLLIIYGSNVLWVRTSHLVDTSSTTNEVLYCH